MSRCCRSCRLSESTSRSEAGPRNRSARVRDRLRFLPAGFAVLLFVCVLGCAGDTTAPATREEIVVSGHLYIGETVSIDNSILITRTQPVDEFYDLEEAAVTDALVLLRKEGRDRADTLQMVSPGRYAAPHVAIEERTTYHLSVEIDGESSITATTTTPHAFEMTREPRQVPETMRHDEIPDIYPMLLTCPEEEQIFLLNVYCLEEWQDARYINPFGDHDQPEDFEEYGQTNDEPRHIFAYFRIKNVEREEERFRISFYSAMMVFYGLYDVQILSIDDNYYNYLYREHPEESGGIEGGIGVFGSAHRRQYTVEVIE
jgi:hypothetical protein